MSLANTAVLEKLYKPSEVRMVIFNPENYCNILVTNSNGCGVFPLYQAILRHKLGALPYNPILIASSWR